MQSRREQEPSSEELGRLAGLLARNFIQRWDMYPKQLQDGSYITLREPLGVAHLLAHLRGEMTLGMYLLNAESKGRFLVLDADHEGHWDGLVKKAPRLAEEGLSCYLEGSRRGGHVWFFLNGWLASRDIRLFALGLLDTLKIPVAKRKVEGIEIYPKQDTLLEGQPGSLVRLPFGVHRKSNRRYGFRSSDGQPLAPRLREQLKVLSHPQRVSDDAFRSKVSIGASLQEQTVFESPERRGSSPVDSSSPVSERIKAAIPLLEFISRFAPEVRLSTDGRGHCPFHEDKHTSFGVFPDHREGIEKWNCFAGCGSGTVIDFWMLYREKQGQDSSFKATIKELAQMLL